jgi:hypothetical protein
MPTRKVVLADLDASRFSSLAPSSFRAHNRGQNARHDPISCLRACVGLHSGVDVRERRMNNMEAITLFVCHPCCI